MYTAITPTTVQTRIVNGLTPIPIVDLESQLSMQVHNDLNAPEQFARFGMPRDLAGIQSLYGIIGTRLIGTYPDIANGKDPVKLAQDAGQVVFDELSKKPMDPSGIRDAGMIAPSNLGDVPFDGNVPVLSQFPLVQPVAAPAQPSTKDKFNAPMPVFMPKGYLEPGFLAVGFGGIEWIGGPGLPANWQDLPSAVALGL